MGETEPRSAAELVGEYLEAQVPSVDLLREMIRRGTELVPLLIDVLLVRPPDREPDDHRGYPDQRAAWLLFHLRPPDALPVFERVMLDPEREDISICFEWDLLAYGPAAFSVLHSVLRAASAPRSVRENAAWDLGRLGAAYPEVRESAVADLREILDTEVPTRGERERARLAGACAGSLLQLGDEPSVPRIRDLEKAREFRADAETLEVVRMGLGGWRTLSARTVNPVEFDILSMHDELPWLDDDFGDHECSFCGDELHGPHDHGPPEKAPEPIRREAAKTGRNDPCPCGSGKKFKRCCGG